MKAIKAPRAVQRFMRDFEQTEAEVKEYILSQLEFHDSLADQAATEEQWIAFKLGCSSTGALLAIVWARS